MSQDNYRFDTNALHAGEPHPRVEGAITQPIFQSSTYEYSGEADYDSLKYIRLNNTPNHIVLEKKLAALEGVEAGLIASSGMAAITTALLALVEEGGHVVAQRNLYGGTFHFLAENFPKLGRKVTFCDVSDLNKFAAAIRPETKALYVESLSNPLLRIPDLEAVAKLARERKLLSFIDNTFATPVNFQPARMGYDVILHSATKYLNGHTDIVAGCVLGKAELVAATRRLLNSLGGCLDPNSCYLLNRGIKTLGVRVRAQNEAALKLAKALEGHSLVKRVHYPFLPSHPEHGRAKEWMRGGGGVVAFEFAGDGVTTDKMLSRLRIPCLAPSLGGVESLVTRPVTTSHLSVPDDERRACGVFENTVRISVGLEDIDDLIADFVSALDTCK